MSLTRWLVNVIKNIIIDVVNIFTLFPSSVPVPHVALFFVALLPLVAHARLVTVHSKGPESGSDQCSQ